MATIFIIFGSILGFGTAVTAYTAFGASLATALLIWGASGPLSALIAALAMLFRRAAGATARHTTGTRVPDIA